MHSVDSRCLACPYRQYTFFLYRSGPKSTSGGEGGIRTLGTLLRLNTLAVCCFRPLSHLSVSGHSTLQTPYFQSFQRLTWCESLEFACRRKWFWDIHSFHAHR